MKTWILALIVGITLLASCDNELDINAPWKETPVVYAVIDLGQDSQIIRIQKTFQNASNQTSNTGAQIADSLVMKNIAVTITNSTNPNQFFSMQRLAPRKDSGFFSNKDSSYWGARVPGFFAPGGRYILKIHSYNTGNDYLATADMVGTATLNQLSTLDLANTSNMYFIFQVENFGINVSVLDLSIRLKYWELNKAGGDTLHKFIDYYVKKDALRNTLPSGKYSTSVEKESYVSFLKNNIKPDANVTRGFEGVEYVVTSYNNDYRDMLSTNAPSGSIIPKYGEYSNISNGIGIFASRTITRRAQNFNGPTTDLLNNQVLNR